MSYIINRANNFKAVKKNITISNTIKTFSLKESLGSTASNQFLSLDDLTINNTLINASADQLSYLQVIPGIATKLRGLVVDSNKNINTINILNCSSNIIVNNIPITNISDLNTGSSDDLNNPYLTNTTIGIAKANKALVSNQKNNISTINKLTSNNIKIKNYNIQFNKNNEIYDTNLYSKLNYYPGYNYVDKLFNNSTISVGSYAPGVTNWKACCWSQELNLFVIVGSSGTNKRVLISSDGICWNEYPSSNDQIQWFSICWSPELNLFVGGGTNGHTMYSYDGKIWLPGSVMHSNTIVSICWSKELNLFVAVSSSGNITNSTDGINWTISESNYYTGMVFTSVCWANNLNLFLACSSGNNNSNRLLISNNGYIWQPIYHNVIDNAVWRNITWSEELNTLIMTGMSSPQRIIKSNDGINWDLSYAHESSSPQWYWYGISKCVWVKELHIFIAILESYAGMYYSYDGIKWKYVSIADNQMILICWSNILGSLLIGTNNNTLYLLQCSTKTYLSGLLSNKEGFNINQNNNYVGIGTINPLLPLHINNSDGKCLRMHPNPRNAGTIGYTGYLNFCEFNITNNGQLNINSTSSTGNAYNVNINTDNTTYGLKLNNILLLPTTSEYNTLTNITNGIATNSKVLIADSSNNISNINLLMCNSLTVNGINIDDSNNNQYTQNLLIGNASTNKALITNMNNNIININSIKTKKFNLNYDNYFGSEQFNNVNLNNLNNKYKIPNKYYLTNKINSNNWQISSTYDSISWNKIIWCAKLNLFVGMTSNGIYTSHNGILWTVDSYLTGNYLEICWAEEINTLLVFNNNSGSPNIYISHDGKTWINSSTSINWIVYGNSSLKCIWAPEIKSFVLVSDNGQVVNGVMSKDGYYWSHIGVPSSKSWNGICWCNKLNLFVAVANNSNTTNTIITSTDMCNWTNYNITGFTGSNPFTLTTACYSPDLNIIILCSGTNVIYSYDGITWFYNSTTVSINNVIWIKELSIFLGTIAYGSFSYSYDGINWSSLSHPITGFWNAICWAPEMSTLIIGAFAGSSRIGINAFGLPNTKSYLSALPNQLYFDKINSRMGIGLTNPNYQLELSTDNAAKPSSSTWTIVSDSRLKDNIELANLNQCYDIIKNLKLRRYTWKDNIFNTQQIFDRTKLGWIADEVEELFPKAVSKKNAYNLNDCKTLNIDQIIASVYGFAQKLINEYENIDEDISILQSKTQNIENFINSLDIL